MKLRVTPQAERQVDDVLASIQAHSPSGASRIGARLRQAFDLLKLPRTPAGSRTGLACDVFVIAPYPYMIFYRIDPDAVVILGIRHASREPL